MEFLGMLDRLNLSYFSAIAPLLSITCYGGIRFLALISLIPAHNSWSDLGSSGQSQWSFIRVLWAINFVDVAVYL